MRLIYSSLAQTMPGASPATQGSGGLTGPGSPYHLDWGQWVEFHGWWAGVRSLSALVLILLLGLILSGMFRKLIEKYQLGRAVQWGTLAIAAYSAIVAAHPVRLTDRYDLLALAIHKLFVAIMILVGFRFFDRLVVIPLMTRGGRVVVSRFIHQITLAIVGLFLIAGYLHWAFDVDVSSLLAGSAVISIVLGLALQETLGNFFSGMVLQASVPFEPGDWIVIGEGSTAVEGRVVEMTWRAVTLLAGDNNNVLIPNSQVARSKITNYHTPTRETARSVSVGLEYSLPPHEARRVLLLAAGETAGISAMPAPSVSLASYDASAVTYKLVFWIDKPGDHGAIEAAVRWNVWYRLQQAGMSVPFDTKTVAMWDPAKEARDRAAAMRGERLAAIQKSSLFSTVSAERQELLAARSRDFYLAAGQVFYRQGEPGIALYLVLSGTAHAVIRTEGGREIDLGDTAIGGVFGETSAVTGQARTATVLAKTDVRAAEIRREQLQELLAAEPSLAKHMSEVVAQSQARREEVMRSLGAKPAAQEEATHSQGVLERMRKLFNLIHR